MQSLGTLLVVDDEQDIVETLVDDFTRQGIQCITAFDGRSAFALIQNKRPDAILSDINMPGMSGLELLSQVKSSGLETPFLFLTGYSAKEKLAQALRLGAFDFFEKPYELKAWMTSVVRAVELGIELKNIESELMSLCKVENISQKNIEQYKAIKKILLVAQKYNRAQLKKTG